MKPTTYALIVALTVGAAPIISATAQQEVGRHTYKPSLNSTPVVLAPVHVTVPSSDKAQVARTAVPLNNVPVELPPVHIVAPSREGQGAQPVQVQDKENIPERTVIVLRVALSDIQGGITVRSGSGAAWLVQVH